MAGHIPKLYISRVRYDLWRQLARMPTATATSDASDLECTVGAFAVCDELTKTGRLPQDMSAATFCHPACGTNAGFALLRYRSDKARNMLPQPCARSDDSLTRNCRSYSGVDFAAEAPLYSSSKRRKGHAQYLSESMTYRFCIVSPGDNVGTAKIAESILVLASGGCIPPRARLSERTNGPACTPPRCLLLTHHWLKPKRV